MTQHTFTLSIKHPTLTGVELDMTSLASDLLRDQDGDYCTTVYNYSIDAGELGHLEVDLNDVEVDVNDLLNDIKADAQNMTVDVDRYFDLSDCEVEAQVTLQSVREAYCEQHSCTPYEYVARVVEDLTDNAMRAARSAQMVERELEESEVKHRLERRHQADLLWAVQKLKAWSFGSTVSEETETRITAILADLSKCGESEEVTPMDTEEVA